MVSFSKFTSSKAPALFEIRVDNDFIVFRGGEHESPGQLLKGTVVLCLTQPLKVEDVTLRLTGSRRVNWTDSRISSTGVTNHRVDRTTEVYGHRWHHLTNLATRANDAMQPKSTILEPGNYEYPFEHQLPGDLPESIEGLREGSITYKLKATISRGRLSHDLHTYKQIRLIRTLEPSALEFLHAMSVENIWPNKVEYSITVPQKAVVFGTSIPLETRFTPLLKGLELGDVTVKLMESQDIFFQSSNGHNLREFRKEKEVQSWTIPMNRDEHWQDMIEDTGQEGWVMKTELELPRKLGRCIQDVNTNGIKIRHKLKMVVALKNPDGHVSELRATLPVSIFISPNMPLDEDGTLIRQVPQGVTADPVLGRNTIAPPVYAEHKLDQLIAATNKDGVEITGDTLAEASAEASAQTSGPELDANGLQVPAPRSEADQRLDQIFPPVDPSGLQTPAPRSGVSTPTFGHSRGGSADNLQALSHPITAAQLSSRLQHVSFERSRRNHSYNSLNELGSGGGNSGVASPRQEIEVSHFSPPPTAPMSRGNSRDGSPEPEHVDYPELAELNKVPSYQTAIKTPLRQLSYQESYFLPDYQTAISAPNSRGGTPPESPQPTPSSEVPPVDIMEAIEEVPQESSSPTDEHPPHSPDHSLSSRESSPASREPSPASGSNTPPTSQRPAIGRRRRSSLGLSFSSITHHVDDESRRVHLLQMRDRVI